MLGAERHDPNPASRGRFPSLPGSRFRGWLIATLVSLLLASLACAQSDIFRAAQTGDLVRLEAWLDTDPEVDIRSSDGSTPLIEAAYAGQLAAVERLVAAGADVNARKGGADGATVLMFAAQRSRPAVVEVLLAAGADPRLEDRWGNRAIDYALENPNSEVARQLTSTPNDCALAGNLSCLEALAQSGADLDEIDERGRTPIIMAARAGQLEAVRLLLANGADLGYALAFPDPEVAGQLALMFDECAAAGHLSCLEAFVRSGADIDQVNRSRQTPLSVSAGAGHLEAVRLLLAAGVDSESTYNSEALDNAAYNGHLEILEALLAAGLSSRSAVSNAVRNRQFEAARLLLRAGLPARLQGGIYTDNDVILEDPELLELLTLQDPGNVSIYTVVDAVLAGDRATLGILIGVGVDINRRVDHKHGLRTPLYFAVQEADVDTVRLLLEAGADPNIGDFDGTTPLMEAAGHGQLAIARLLLGTGADVNDFSFADGDNALVRAVMAEDDDMVRLLFDHGFDPNHRLVIPVEAYREHVYSALMVASRQNALDHVRVLLDHGADPNLRDLQERTSLFGFWATYGQIGNREPSEELVRALVAAGAEIDARDRAGMTPLMDAASRGWLEKVELLLDLGADPTLRDGDGNRALDYLLQNERLELPVEIIARLQSG